MRLFRLPFGEPKENRGERRKRGKEPDPFQDTPTDVAIERILRPVPLPTECVEPVRATKNEAESEPDLSEIPSLLRHASETAKALAVTRNQNEPQEYSRIYELAGVYRQTRDFEWLQEQLESADPNEYLSRDHTLSTDLIRDGHADWIVRQLRPPFPRANQQTYGYLLSELAGNGQARWVVDHVPILQSAFVDKYEMELLIALCRERYAEVVAQRVRETSRRATRSLERFNLVKILANCGLMPEVLELIDQPGFDMEPGNNGTVAAILAEHGYPERAITQISSHVPTITDANHAPVWYKNLAYDLSAYADRPEVREWLDSQPAGLVPDVRPQKDPSTLTYARPEIKRAAEHLSTTEQKERDVLAAILRSALFLVEGEERDRLDPLVTAWAKHLSGPELAFVCLGIPGTGVFSDAFARLVDFTLGTRAEFVFELSKTGSKLFLYGRREPATRNVQITFVNDIVPAGATAWMDARDAGIPVAPIVQAPVARRNGRMRVYSRYCGKAVHVYLNPDIPSAFQSWVRAEADRIRVEVAKRGLEHGHMHYGNFTVEFIRTDYMRRQAEAGTNVNEVPYDASQFSFDPIPYFEAPSEWTPVVRLIDWDRATSAVS